MTEEFSGDPDGWQRSPVVCFLENMQLGRWSVLTDGYSPALEATFLTRDAMRVIADQMRALLPSNLEKPSNSLRSNFVEELEYAATIEAIPLPTIPVFPKKCMAVREAFKDWSWE